MRADDVREALRKRFADGRRYAIAEEVGLTTGFSHRRLDMMVLDCYASNGFRIDGIEIKVSKADLKRELEDPEKHVAFFDVIDYYTLACPKGIADLRVIPPKWGVMQVNEDGTTRYVRKPIALRDDVQPDVPRGFLASIVRAIQGRDPSTNELRAQYELGRKEEREYQERYYNYQKQKLRERAADLDKYEELKMRLHLWGDQDEALEKFERFQNLGLNWLIPSLKRNIETMQELVSKLEPEEGRD